MKGQIVYIEGHMESEEQAQQALTSFERWNWDVELHKGLTAETVQDTEEFKNLNIIEKSIRLSETSHIKENIYKESKEKNVNFGKLMQFLRISLVGSLNGPDVFFIIGIIGKNVTLRRFNSLLNKTKKQ